MRVPALKLCMLFAAIAAIAVVLGRELIVWHPEASHLQAASLDEFERELAAMREPLEIPGMSAAIGQGDRILWTRGFGHADRERATPAAPETIYHLASVTKPYAAVVVLQLVDEGRIDLNQPVSDFGIALGGTEPIRVWHLLSHTSSGRPGTTFRYDGAAFGHLTRIVEKATGKPFAVELTDRIVRKLALSHTAPNPRDVAAAPPEDPGRRTFAESGLDRARIDAALATGYGRSTVLRSLTPMEHPTYLFASAGLVASAPDVVRFSIALDRGALVRKPTLDRAYAPAITSRDRPSPYGLGWFVQMHRGLKVVWHFGQGYESSSLLIKIPERRLTFVALANSDGLSRGRRLGDHGDVLRSPVATLFLNWSAKYR